MPSLLIAAVPSKVHSVMQVENVFAFVCVYVHSIADVSEMSALFPTYMCCLWPGDICVVYMAYGQCYCAI